MLEIAGGILIAVLVLMALPFILEAAVWILAIGFVLAIVAGVWFGLSSVVGESWAVVGMLVAVFAWLVWSEKFDENDGASNKRAGAAGKPIAKESSGD